MKTPWILCNLIICLVLTPWQLVATEEANSVVGTAVFESEAPKIGEEEEVGQERIAILPPLDWISQVSCAGFCSKDLLYDPKTPEFHVCVGSCIPIASLATQGVCKVAVDVCLSIPDKKFVEKCTILVTQVFNCLL